MILKTQLIEKLVPQVVESFTMDDLIKFVSTVFFSFRSDWPVATTTQIQSVRENGDSTINNNQIRKVYIDQQGFGYTQNQSGVEVNIIGDGTGGKVVIDTDSEGKITKTNVSSGGQGYTYGMVDLGSLGNPTTRAKLVPIIPPSRGHGFDLYKELGTDKLLVYARFDDSTKDFPTDTKFSQISIIKNPTSIGSTSTFTANQFSSVNAIKVISPTGTPVIGEKIEQSVTGGTALGYIVSYDTDTNVVKYYQDRSLVFNQTTGDQTDYAGITTESRVLSFESSADKIIAPTSGFQASVDQNFSGISTNPSYGDVCTGLTGHNEVVKILFDPMEVSYLDILATFWENHDPTQMNRQGNDIGTQYRSGAYYFSEAQKLRLLETKAAYEGLLRKAGFGSIVTEIKKVPEFFLAEDYHQQYLAKNPQGYCGLGGTGIDLKRNLENPIEAL